MSKVRVTLKKSKIGRPNNQKLILEALGLGKINSSVEKELNPSIQGMIDKVKHLVVTEEI
ncbi:MAG: 50S ribosomal protein L30 [Bacteroidales bacterium]|jgi:large subunit ribosomal protein L30|nr:50S ribosomal protein L30 [Bacteroidales bacterium]